MARFVITGGSGFIGSALATAIQARGDTAIIASRGRHGTGPADWIEYDLDRPETAACLLDLRPDGVFHLAWSNIPSSAEEEPVADVRTNLAGTVALFRALSTKDIPVVFLSSGGTVYGIPQTTPISETHPLRPIGIYGMGKVAAENYAAIFRRSRRLDVRVARLSNPFGSHHSDAKPQGAASIFLRQIMRGDPVKIMGDGSIVRDYLHVSDAAGGILSIMDMKPSTDEEVPTYNIGSGEGVSLTGLVEAISEVSGVKAQIEYLASRAFDVPVNILDTKKLHLATRWRPCLSFREAMALAVSELE